METNHVVDLLSDYLDKTLSEVQMQEVEAHLKKCNDCTVELSQLKTLYIGFEEEPIAVPSEKLRAGFLQQLELEKQAEEGVVFLNRKADERKFPWATIFKVAASVLLLIGAFQFGKLQQQEASNATIAALESEGLESRQTAMLSLMENQSASKRIQGVGYIDGFADPDELIVKALVDRMLNDENANVRMTAVEALDKFTNSEIVKRAFITALKSENDSGIQIEIIEILVRIQEKKAVEPMKKLLEREDIQPFVKEQIESLLPTFI